MMNLRLRERAVCFAAAVFAVVVALCFVQGVHGQRFHLEDNQFGTLIGNNQACRHCGIRPFGKGRLKVLGGDFYAINLSTIDVEQAAAY